MTPSHGAWRFWRPALAGVVVFVVSWLALLYTLSGGGLAPFWPGNALALVWLLRARGDKRADWACLVAGLGAANVAAGGAFFPSAVFTISNACDIAVAYAVMRWPLPPAAPGAATSDPRRVFFVVCGAVVAPAAGATLSSILIAPQMGITFAEMWIAWWLPSALAMLIIAPLGLFVSGADAERMRRPRMMVETAACLTTVLLTMSLIVASGRMPLIFLVVPLILYAGVRLRALGVAVVVAITACIAVPMASGALGPVQSGVRDTQGRVFMTQVFLVINAIAALALAAILDERDALLRVLDARREAASAQAQAKSRLLMSVSHEIRTPLNVIQGLGEMLADRATLDARQHTLVEGMLNAARRLQALAHDLLDTARIEQGAMRLAPETFRPAPMLRALIDEESHHGDAPTSIHLDVREDIEIWGDPLRFQQIAQNLLSNAVKYSASHGPITIAVRAGPMAARVEVIDRGPGFPLGATHLAFEPFAWAGRGQANDRSVGVGLSLVKMLAEAHGGGVGCSSTPHVETRVWAELPLQHAPTARGALKAAATDEPDPAEIFSERER